MNNYFKKCLETFPKTANIDPKKLPTKDREYLIFYISENSEIEILFCKDFTDAHTRALNVSENVDTLVYIYDIKNDSLSVLESTENYNTKDRTPKVLGNFIDESFSAVCIPEMYEHI